MVFSQPMKLVQECHLHTEQLLRAAMMLAVVSLLALASPCLARDILQAVPAVTSWREERYKLAAHAIGVNFAFMEVCSLFIFHTASSVPQSAVLFYVRLQQHVRHWMQPPLSGCTVYSNVYRTSSSVEDTSAPTQT